MGNEVQISPVAWFRAPFSSKFGIPRQSGIVEELRGRIVFLREFGREEAIRGLEGFEYIWVIWGFSGNDGKWGLTVRPPRLGGNRTVGVFASRSPFRPNGLGLSSVRILDIDREAPEGLTIHVGGADLMDGTPIYDIKPYIRYTDSHPDAKSGFADEEEWHEVKVVFPEDLQHRFLEIRKNHEVDRFRPEAGNRDLLALKKVLGQKPIPQYIQNPDRIWGMPFMGCDIRFCISDRILTVIEIIGLENK